MPSASLHNADDLPPLLPSCVHYAGTEGFIAKSIARQKKSAEKFDIACDLEDGASVGAEKELLKKIIEIIDQYDPAQGRIGVRLHPADSDWHKDEVDSLIKKVGKKLAFLTLPKAADAKEVQKLAKTIATRCKSAKLKAPIPLHVLIETRTALGEVSEIAAISGVQCLEFGLLDFISDHGGIIPESCMQSPGQFEHRIIASAKSAIVNAALRYAKVPAHNVCIDLQDSKRIYADALRARSEYGFLRMWSIHPAQIEPIQRAMRPDFSALPQAREILKLAEAASWAPIRYQDKLYDRASYRTCQALVKRAEFYGVV